MDKDNGVKVEGMFAECDSPSLIEIYSSCDRKVRLFYDLIGEKTGIYTRKSYKYLTLYPVSQIYFK